MNDFSFYFALGWEHIMSLDALDHILFVLVLAAGYLPSDWKKVLVLVTAFTIGHSITLALSTLQLVDIPGNWIEFLIPCTIVITAFLNFFRKDFGGRVVWLTYLLALFFGLVHGLGFANTLRFILAKDQNLGWALFGFNVGLEAGQILIVILILAAAWVAVQMLRVPRREWVLVLSGAVFSLSLQMALERLP